MVLHCIEPFIMSQYDLNRVERGVKHHISITVKPRWPVWCQSNSAWHRMFLIRPKKMLCFWFHKGLSKKCAECNISLAQEEKTNVTHLGQFWFFGYCQSSWFVYYAPAIFNGGAYSITAVRTSVRPVCNTFGFRAISFERIGVLDWNFIHRYKFTKRRSSSI